MFVNFIKICLGITMTGIITVLLFAIFGNEIPTRMFIILSFQAALLCLCNIMTISILDEEKEKK